jgi:hypothetical protein
MWARLDDELIDHIKVFEAGERLGKNGPAIALGFYAVALMWSNKHLTDGFLPLTTIKKFTHVEDPLTVADALTRAGLFDRINGTGRENGYRIHDFGDYNPSAAAIRKKRKADRLRKAEDRAALVR